ncbi:haloacid dehalogenase-like hydrolase [Bifidobacterium sp. DSM 109958]|uniref:Haloacid dehalogenase-like hydrolase n=1 Tax=Bifidobacterium moraviense TaxID=2675323 RepID=A0A7Y0F2Y6_9BIFI|nr:HAD family hydrolase [Bifidobacterium sp. DSM 109958]NMN01064.1 haloacid dehalogenase-like hydrolase [Bifidobacterium sp. DSM 109958]
MVTRTSAMAMPRSASRRRYDVAFFDLYGTLVDIRTDESSPCAWAALCGAIGRLDPSSPYRDEPSARDAFDCAMALLEPADAGEHYEPDMLPVYRALLPGLSGEAATRAARELAWTFRRACTNLLRLYPGVHEMLDALRSGGLRVVLLSNAQSCYTRPELALLGLDAALDRIVISSEEGVRKPSAALYRRALEREGLSDRPDRAVMVGNDVRCDILGAAAAGVDGVYVRTAISPAGDPHVCPQAVLTLRGDPAPDYAALLDFLLG